MTTTRRALFVATILTGSFLLFLVQPLVARMALPRLGGAPNVWNSAMLVYQALLLAGYAYAHALGRLPVRRQAMIHVALLLLAALSLPIALAELAPPAPGWEPLWVPALLAVTIGPVFFLVSAQAPLMQKWYAADEAAGDPYWLYAASNFGSFGGLIAYPLLLEPNMAIASQSNAWSLGYIALIVLVAACGWARWRAGSGTQMADAAQQELADEPIPMKRILLWLALAAVPSGLMLSTTTHLTTDIVAMPLLWVIPLGLYLLSFTVAFTDNRTFASSFIRSAPAIVLLAGGMAMVSRGGGTMSVAIASVLMLFVVAVALHGRLYDLRPHPSRLTFFYLVMSAGGALGGLFTALIAPVVFDWVWEHPLLVLAAAALIPQIPLLGWMKRTEPQRARLIVLGMVAVAVLLGIWMMDIVDPDMGLPVLGLMLAIAALGILVIGCRPAFVAIVLVMMLGRGGVETMNASLDDARNRSYFGVYTVSESEEGDVRWLAHGTTMHGVQFRDSERHLLPTSYYGEKSGAGLALRSADAVMGRGATVGVVGLGTGTLACYRKPEQQWHFYEIDPVVVEYSRNATFTYLSECTPDAQIHLGDARVELAKARPDQFDLLLIDAFSSDAIPIHLITREAIDTYDRALEPGGMIMFHISNRYVDLAPVLSAAAAERGWVAMMRDDPGMGPQQTASFWVAVAETAEPIAKMMQYDTDAGWSPLGPPIEQSWTDDYASIIPLLEWDNLVEVP